MQPIQSVQAIVIVMSLGFILFVTVLHVTGKVRSALCIRCMCALVLHVCAGRCTLILLPACLNCVRRALVRGGSRVHGPRLHPVRDCVGAQTEHAISPPPCSCASESPQSASRRRSHMRAHEGCAQ